MVCIPRGKRKLVKLVQCHKWVTSLRNDMALSFHPRVTGSSTWCSITLSEHLLIFTDLQHQINLFIIKTVTCRYYHEKDAFPGWAYEEYSQSNLLKSRSQEKNKLSTWSRKGLHSSKQSAPICDYIQYSTVINQGNMPENSINVVKNNANSQGLLVILVTYLVAMWIRNTQDPVTRATMRRRSLTFYHLLECYYPSQQPFHLPAGNIIIFLYF